MPKQEARVDANHPNKSTWQSVWMTILFAVLTAGLSVFVWIITLRAGNSASLGVLLSLMVVPVILPGNGQQEILYAGLPSITALQ